MPPIVRRFWTQPRRIASELLALDDSPHAIAAGAAVGIWLGLTPTVGIQMVLVALLAWMCRGWLYFNRTAALLMVYITNPLTIVPIYWFNYQVGATLIGGSATKDELARSLKYDDLPSWWDSVEHLISAIGWPLLVGSLIVATIGAAFTYPLMRWSVRKLRSDAPGDQTIAVSIDDSAAPPTEAD